MARRARGGETPIRITTAATSRNADIAARQRRYLIAMGIRTLCFLMVALVAITHVGPSWFPWIFVVGALVLPYVAVVMANAAETKSDAFELRDGSSRDRELPPGTHSE
jgi:threonine/homoserine/homoserine lactone efflux protein